MNVLLRTCFTAISMWALTAGSVTQAAEITILCTNALKEAMLELGPAFEGHSGNRLVVDYDSTNGILGKLAGGTKADLVIMADAAIDKLIKEGKIAGPRTDLGRVGIGLAVRAGASKPDISSPEALKSALLAAKSVAISKVGLSGLHFRKVTERLGIAEQMNPKLVVVEIGPTGAMVAKGEAEIAVQQMSELMPVAGIDIVGPLPGDLQSILQLSTGVTTDAKEAEAAKALVKFLSSAPARTLMKKKGVDAG